MNLRDAPKIKVTQTGDDEFCITTTMLRIDGNVQCYCEILTGKQFQDRTTRECLAYGLEISKLLKQKKQKDNTHEL